MGKCDFVFVDEDDIPHHVPKQQIIKKMSFFKDCSYTISYDITDSTEYEKTQFTYNDATNIISKIIKIFQYVCANRRIAINTILIKLTKKSDNVLGKTCHRDGYAVIYLNLNTIFSLEQIAVVFLHEFSHLIEGKARENHKMTFYSLHIAVLTLCAHYKEFVSELNFDIIKNTKVATYYSSNRMTNQPKIEYTLD